jgi:hypothetical protein
VCTVDILKLILAGTVGDAAFSTDKWGGGSREKVPGPGGPEWGPRLGCVAYVFVILGSIAVYQLYKLTPSFQAHVTL